MDHVCRVLLDNCPFIYVWEEGPIPRDPNPLREAVRNWRKKSRAWNLVGFIAAVFMRSKDSPERNKAELDLGWEEG